MVKKNVSMESIKRQAIKDCWSIYICLYGSFLFDLQIPNRGKDNDFFFSNLFMFLAK